jgi:hypothetical protein
MKKIILSCALGILFSGFLSISTTNVASAQTELETGHWVDLYMGSPVPVLQICAGSGSVCIKGDYRPPSVE